MILHINHTQGSSGHSALPGRASDLVRTLLTLVEEGRVDARLLATLRVHLDWIQYRANFREAVTVRRASDKHGEPVGLAELAVDLRQAEPERFRDDLALALSAMTSEGAHDGDRVFIDDFAPVRQSVIWEFNRLFWQRLGEWERTTGRGFEEALPSGRSDANHPEAVADSVADFWTLLRDMDKRGQLPPEIFALEIGVGSGTRAALWLDRFRSLDEERGTGYYPRLRFLLGDYSMPTLDRAMATVSHHRDTVSVLALEALNPFRTLSFLRYKILYVHLTNVYDNLPYDEVVRRDGRLYLVEARAYLRTAAAQRIAMTFALDVTDLPRIVGRLLDVGPDVIDGGGAAFWRAVWEAIRLEERLVALDDLAETPLPAGLDQHHLEDLLGEAPDDVRFHLSRGAAESFVNTLPLLHPRGYLQVQDIFVTSMDEYRQGFRGPGKLDGSVVSWVNGALLRAVGARAGYDVHFAPFRYRPGSRTSILYTTQRD
ncbi:MAG: hypothetical protein C5B48_12090 [Candidatus Rokuibacteriota bacterium]|nr:MAG: hypothetical protein C5B48_12090 [Candidatus Rokubacteria bacterium]